ncbi:MAG: alpha/beta fold hydrolase [Acidimicrobiales bacterium]|nr:alpha/beta fold hydrolase [Hyphomonadaceae bacterium]RZV44566.1 MAG: alpha/beta fold hydrolase [Acidimicrobiales bacterium]
MSEDFDDDHHHNLPSITYTKVGNQKLRTAIWTGTDKGAGKRTPLLLFNGIGANLDIFQAFADHFTGRDIIAFDMPGIGGSPDPKVPYRPWWVCKAAKQILDMHGYKKVDVLGVSWGGGMAQQFAFQYQKMTERLVLCATAPGITMVPGDMRAISKMGSPKRYINRDFLKAHFEELYGDSEDGFGMFTEHMSPPSLKGYMFQLMCMAGWSSLPFLRFIRVPTIIIAGDRDHIVPLANAKILNFMIKGSRLYEFEDAGHLFLLTKRDESIQIIRDFFEEPEVPMPPLKDILLPPILNNKAA